MRLNLQNKIILITGGTGTFGQAFTEKVLKKHQPKVLRIFSRDEYKQHRMQQRFSKYSNKLRFFIGDVRDKDRLKRATKEVDIIIHAAALKHVPLCEYNPFEAIKTNILGAENVINAAIDNNVKKAVAISTDKAVAPLNLYGATKLCMEKIFIAANAYASKKTKLSCVRYGNVFGSRGSVLPLFKQQRKKNEVTLTDKRMTRFWITPNQAVDFVLDALNEMQGGEIFIPKLPSVRIIDLAKVVSPDAKIEIIGIRTGEKIHEVLLTSYESRSTVVAKTKYIILPNFPWLKRKSSYGGKKISNEFSYSSNTNNIWLTKKELKKFINNEIH